MSSDIRPVPDLKLKEGQGRKFTNDKDTTKYQGQKQQFF